MIIMIFEFNSDNSYLFDISEFTDDDRIHQKIIKAVSRFNPDVNCSININVIAPAIRSTEIDGEFKHKFLRTSDGKFLSLKEE